MKRFIRELLNKIINRYNKRSIRYTIFLSFTLTAILATVLAGLIFYLRFSNQLESAIQDENEILVGQANQTLNTYLRDMIRLSDSLYYNVIKNRDIDSGSVNEDIQLIYNTYSNYVKNIVLFSVDGEILAMWPLANTKENIDVSQAEWFLSALEKTENLHFSSPSVQNLFVDTDYQYDWVISLSCAVEITKGKNTEQGVLLIDLKYSGVTEILNDMTLANGGYVYLTDSDGTIIYHPLQQLLASGLVSENIGQAEEYKDGSFILTSDGKERTVIIRTAGYTGWKVIGVIPHKGITFTRLQNILFILFILLLFFDILMLVNSNISGRLTNPLKSLEHSVELLEEKGWESEIYVGGSYEIRHLGKSIQKMVCQLRKLTDDIVHEHEQKQKSELDVLQSQINPHLLYNTLDIIVWMVENKRPDEAVRVVTALARLFRISLSKGKNIIAVSDELDHVRNYLTIQTMRYKNKFSYEIKADNTILSMATLKLVVQPLVENAIYHSMNYMDGDGKIEIEVKTEGEKLLITVADNGLGMSKEIVDRLLVENVPVSKGSGVGLKNVHERIKLYFGDEYGVAIESEPDVGTRITLIQPLRKYKEEVDK